MSGEPVWEATGVGLAARVTLVVVPPLGVLVTWIAAGEGRAWVVLVAGAVGALAARRPDGHAGLLAVGVLAVDWVATVDDHATPWVLVLAALVAVLHTAGAAAGVAPPRAVWTAAMRRRWLTRLGVAVGAAAVTWVVVALLDGRAGRGRAPVLVAALAIVVTGALWSFRRPAALRAGRDR